MENIVLPYWYDDLYAFECEAKGCAFNFETIINGEKRAFNFYDAVRFSQDAEMEIQQNGYFQDENAVILQKVDRQNIMNYLRTVAIR